MELSSRGQHGHREKQGGRQRDRETDRQTDRQTDTHTHTHNTQRERERKKKEREREKRKERRPKGASGFQLPSNNALALAALLFSLINRGSNPFYIASPLDRCMH